MRAEFFDQDGVRRDSPIRVSASVDPGGRIQSQLKSDRAQLHGVVVAASNPRDQNAALIAERLKAAGGSGRSAYRTGNARRSLVNQFAIAPPRNSAGSAHCEVADALPPTAQSTGDARRAAQL